MQWRRRAWAGMAKPLNSISICEWIARHQPVNCFVAPPAHDPDPGLAIPRPLRASIAAACAHLRCPRGQACGQGWIVVAGGQGYGGRAAAVIGAVAGAGGALGSTRQDFECRTKRRRKAVDGPCAHACPVECDVAQQRDGKGQIGHVGQADVAAKRRPGPETPAHWTQ